MQIAAHCNAAPCVSASKWPRLHLHQKLCKIKKIYTAGQLTLLQMNVDKCGSKLPVIYLNLISQRLNFQLKNTLILQIQEEPLRKYCSYISAGCKILLACELWYYFR